MGKRKRQRMDKRAIRIVDDRMVKDGKHDEDDSEDPLDLARLGEEEQRSEANLLDVQPHKDVLDGFGEEEPAGVPRDGLVELPEEEVLPDKVREEERDAGDSVDDRGDDHVSEACSYPHISNKISTKRKRLTDDHEQRNRREQRPEEHIPKIILDPIHRPRRASKDEQLDIINDKRSSLEQTPRSPRERLQNSIGKEERRRLGQIGSEQVGDRSRVLGQVGNGLDNPTREGSDEETMLYKSSIHIPPLKPEKCNIPQPRR